MPMKMNQTTSTATLPRQTRERVCFHSESHFTRLIYFLGRRASIQPIGDLVPRPRVHSVSGRRPSLSTRAHSYRDKGPAAHGYTANHSRFTASNDAWYQKASAVGNIRVSFSVRVRMGTIKPGQGTIIMIGVSPQATRYNILHAHISFTDLCRGHHRY